MAADREYLKEVFNDNATMPLKDRLAEVASAGAEDIKIEILTKLDNLVWRRKVMDKPYDQLEEIQDLVRSL